MTTNFQVKYRILEIDPTQHSIVVRFYTDKISEKDLATSYITDPNGNLILETRSDGSPTRCQTDYNINIWQTPAPTEEDLKKIISSSAPYDWFNLKHSILDPTVDTSLSNVVALLDKEFVAIKPVSIESIVNTPLSLHVSEDEIEKMITEISSHFSSNLENTTSNTI